MIFFYLGTDAGTRTRTVTRLQIASLAVSAQKLNKYLKSAEHIGNPRVDKILKSLDEGNQKKFKNLSCLKLSKINLRSRNTHDEEAIERQKPIWFYGRMERGKKG